MRKILIIHHSSTIGGAGISLLNIINLAKQDYDITVYVSDLYKDYYDMLQSQNINVKKYNGRIAAIYYHASSGGLKSKAFWLRLTLIPIQFHYWNKIIRSSNAEMVIVNSLMLSWFSILTKNHNINSLCFVRETFAKDGKGLINKIQKKLLSFFTGVSFITKYDEEVANLSNTVKKFINYDYIIPEETSLDLLPNKDEFSVLYLGGIGKIKGIETVIEAADILKKYQDIKFHLLGEDFRSYRNSGFKSISNQNLKLSKKIRNRVTELNLKDNIRFHGIQKSMHKYFSSCDILICPIITPHQQRGVFEAGYYSKPVIASDFKQLHWAVKPGYNGELFEPGNANELAAKILKLYTDRNLCLNEGNNNKLLTMERHIQEVCNKRLVSTLKSIIENKC